VSACICRSCGSDDSVVGFSTADRIEITGWGTARVNISVPILQDVPITQPPETEQRALVEYLNKETAALDKLIAKTNDAIEQLREYRTALISLDST
jgi:hypothetical protein